MTPPSPETCTPSPSDTPDLTLRRATPEDAEALLALARGLARYERAPDAVTATVEDYRRALGPDALCEAHIALYRGAPVGFALYFFTFSTWTGKPSLYLEDLYVEPEHRKRGIGKALFSTLARIALQRGCARYEWQVLDWNALAIDFYTAHGAEARKDWIPFRLEGDALRELARQAP